MEGLKTWHFLAAGVVVYLAWRYFNRAPGAPLPFSAVVPFGPPLTSSAAGAAARLGNGAPVLDGLASPPMNIAPTTGKAVLSGLSSVRALQAAALATPPPPPPPAFSDGERVAAIRASVQENGFGVFTPRSGPGRL